jgi:hypothetical protein
MFTPEFPYKGNQAIISSDRVILHSKSDAIFLFGKQAVSLSSTKTINLDAVEKILIDCEKIELGHSAQVLGQPVVLGRNLNTQLIRLVGDIATASTMLAQVSETDLGSSMEYIADAGRLLNGTCNDLLAALNKEILLSKNTFTR